MWVGIIVITVIYVIYLINKDYKNNVKTNVTNHGGMLAKYSLLIEYFTTHPSCKVRKVTRDGLLISSHTMNITIDYIGTKTEVNLKAYLPVMGNISNRWVFNNGYPQEKMIEEIDSYLSWEMEKMNKLASKDFDKYFE